MNDLEYEICVDCRRTLDGDEWLRCDPCTRMFHEAHGIAYVPCYNPATERQRRHEEVLNRWPTIGFREV